MTGADEPLDAVARFIAARNARDEAALLAAVTSDLEMHLSRGIQHGPGPVRQWIARMSFGIAPEIALGPVLYARGDALVTGGRTRWYFVEDGTPADDWADSSIGWRVREGRVALFAPHSRLEDAVGAVGLGPSDAVAGG